MFDLFKIWMRKYWSLIFTLNCDFNSFPDIIFLSCLFSPEPLYIDDLENMLEEALYSLDTTTEDSIVEEVCLLAIFFA
jgi:hypothetical protein